VSKRRHLESVPAPRPGGGPYGAGAAAYFQHGWSPLPLPPGEKTFPPTGYTGGSGRKPSAEEVARWIRTKAAGNICLRVPENVIGIDVDAYGEKRGATTLSECEERWGPLPATWRTTSREDGVSGIRLFRVPEGLAWPGQLPGGGVELVRFDHRYAIVAPSIHDKTGAEYFWWTPEGEPTSSAEGLEFPAVEELPEMPAAWVSGLTEGKPWVSRAEEDLDPEEVRQWILDRGAAETATCDQMERTLNKWLAAIRAGGEDGGAHDAARDGAWALLGDSLGGHKGVAKALGRLRSAFKEAIKGRRADAFAREWESIKSRGVRKIAAEGEPEEDDPCELGETSRKARERRGGSSDMEFARDDTGNAQRFALRYRDSVRYVEAMGGWHIWSDREGVWALDRTGEVTRMAIETANSIEKEAEYLDQSDPNYAKQKAALLKFVRASRAKAKLVAMTELARDLKGMTVGAELFNANTNHLVTPSGTVELGAAPKLKRSVQEHYNTVSTGVPYRPGERSPYWDKFLERFQPDVEVREWLQKLAGYSLLGKNPGRLMVVCLGPTSTGKTTFAKAMSAALGGYAATTNMTVFRDAQDERPRADLIKILPRRFVYAEEASQSWHLHPDQIKRLTGGAPISARLPYAKEYVDTVPAFTPWLMTNAAPTIEGADAALWRRLMIVPFFTQIPQEEEDEAFERELLSSGAPAILNWLVEGYAKYAADPEALTLSKIPLGAMGAVEDFRSDVSDFARALNEIVEKGEEYREAPQRLYDAYINWCGVHGVPERDRLSGTRFGKELSGLGYAKKQLREDGKPTWFRLGVRLRAGVAKSLGV
jgi:putative DNA primase/helicase